MATLAPYSANRMAIAWPIPELPPVIRTFLSSRPRRPLVLSAVAMASDISPPSSVQGLGARQSEVASRYRATVEVVLEDGTDLGSRPMKEHALVSRAQAERLAHLLRLPALDITEGDDLPLGVGQLLN